METKRNDKKGIDDIIRQIKEIPSYPPNICFLTYCIFGDRLYYRLEGPKIEGHVHVSYYFSTGDRETKNPGIGQGWVGFPLEKYVEDLKAYIEKRDLRVQLRKVEYCPAIERKKRLTNEEVKSIFDMAAEIEEENKFL